MNSLLLFPAIIAFCAGSYIPVIPGDNTHYVEGVSQYIWMPDGDGVPHLVDLKAPIIKEPKRQGSNNAYWLYTRSNPVTAQMLVHESEVSISLSNFNANQPITVIVHGWNSNGNADVNTAITTAILNVQDANVIVVDWSKLASSLYVLAAGGVPEVGEYLGNFLIWLINTTGANWNNVHLIGHSLGAHVVGNAGRTTGGLPARITGLDPAGPLWLGNSNAITDTDGQYVEGIHTDGRLLGIYYPIGHADFYPNGGTNPQPGCLISTCSHGRSHELMAASIQFNHLVGQKCEDLDEASDVECLGVALQLGNSILTKRGVGLYALATESSWPF